MMNRVGNYKLRITNYDFRKLLAICLIVCGSFAHAETILLKNAVVHTVSAETIANGSVLLQGGKIVRVFDNKSPNGSLVPNGTKEIDLNGQHLYPGLIALDTALGLSEI